MGGSERDPGVGRRRGGRLVIALRKITIKWSESPAVHDGCTFTSFAAASAVLSAAARQRAPFAGGYYKTSVIVEWADGETYEARIDLQHETHGHLANVVGAHVRSFCEFSSGRKCPPHMTAEAHVGYLAATEAHRPGAREGFAHVLDTYALDDGMPTIDGKPAERPAPVAPTPEEIRVKRGEGTKYDAARSLADIKRGIVADIKACPMACPMARYTVSVAKSRGSMCRPEVRVTVAGLPFPVIHPDLAAALRMAGSDNRYHGPWMSAEADAVYDTLRAICEAYGYDRSDSQTDYFDRAFGVTIRFDAQSEEWSAARAEYRPAPVRPDFIDWTEVGA